MNRRITAGHGRSSALVFFSVSPSRPMQPPSRSSIWMGRERDSMIPALPIRPRPQAEIPARPWAHSG